MEIIAIEEKTFEQMLQRFADFEKDVKELCRDNQANMEWLDNQDVCNLLSISKRTLQIGHKCYYKKSDIEKLVTESMIKNTDHGNKG